jgi:hypothetical protein
VNGPTSYTITVGVSIPQATSSTIAVSTPQARMVFVVEQAEWTRVRSQSMVARRTGNIALACSQEVTGMEALVEG